MNTNTYSGWNEVGDRLGSLGLKLKYHAAQAAGAEGTTVNDRAEGATVNDALDSMREAIEEAFAALRGVVTDPAIRDDVKSVADGVAQAIATTLREGFKHPGSMVKRPAPEKAATTKKAATAKVGAAKKAATAKVGAAKKATTAKVGAAKKAATAKVGAPKKAAPAKKSAKR